MKKNKLRYMLALSMMLLMGLFVISCGSKDVNPTSPTLSSSEEPTTGTTSVDGKGYATSSGTFLATLLLAVSEGDLDGSTLSYQDEAEELTLNETSITEITLDGNIATIKGTGNLFSNLESGNGNGYSFIATITDDDLPDSMGIKILTNTSSTTPVYELTSQSLEDGDFTITTNP